MYARRDHGFFHGDDAKLIIKSSDDLTNTHQEVVDKYKVPVSSKI